jgi:hypothetical protein
VATNDDLVARYEMLAASQDELADLVLVKGMRVGWDYALMDVEAQLRRQAAANWAVAQELRDGSAS